MDIKKEFITNLLEKSIGSAKEHLVKIGMGDVEVFDSIDKHLIVQEMEAVCSLSGEEMVAVDSFLMSEQYRKYEESLFKMAEVLFKRGFAEAAVAGKGVIH